MALIDLWSYHPPHFDIVNTQSDLKYSDYRSDSEWDGLVRAYHFLREITHGKKFIWCYNFCPSDYHGMFGQVLNMWHLRVPEEEILPLSDTWYSIINDTIYPPDKLYEEFEKKTDEECGDCSVTERDRIFNRYMDEWEKTITNKEEYWHQTLFGDVRSKECGECLIPSPVKEEWVVGKYLLTRYDSEMVDWEGLEEDGETEVYLYEWEKEKKEEIIYSWCKSKGVKWEKVRDGDRWKVVISK